MSGGFTAINLGSAQARLLRVRSQRLTPLTARLHPVDVARDVCGIQAQVLEAAALSIRARSQGLREEAVLRALNEERSLVRTWLMRGTLHIAAAEDVGWLLRLLGPRFAGADRGRRLQLGLDDARSARGIKAIRAVLAAEGPLTREELVERLRRRGLRLDPKGQDRAHLIALTALTGVICMGPQGRGDPPSYVLLDDWISPTKPLSPDAAIARLAARYLAAYGPAGPEDLAVWAGIPVTEARKAMGLIAADLVEVDITGSRAWMLSRVAGDEHGPSGASTRLLPAFDPYLLGYRSRRLAMEPQAEARIQRGGGWLHPTVAVDGWVVGTWRLHRSKRGVEVSVEPFQAIDAEAQAGIDAEVADIGRFLPQTDEVPRLTG
jgi:hypothetical protein